MERPTPEMIVAALRCCSANPNDTLSCKDCPYLAIQDDGAKVCENWRLFDHAADLIEILCGRRAG